MKIKIQILQNIDGEWFWTVSPCRYPSMIDGPVYQHKASAIRAAKKFTQAYIAAYKAGTLFDWEK